MARFRRSDDSNSATAERKGALGRAPGMPALLGTLRYWKASSYSPLEMDLPDPNGRRRNADLLPRLWVGGRRTSC